VADHLRMTLGFALFPVPWSLAAAAVGTAAGLLLRLFWFLFSN